MRTSLSGAAALFAIVLLAGAAAAVHSVDGLSVEAEVAGVTLEAWTTEGEAHAEAAGILILDQAAPTKDVGAPVFVEETVDVLVEPVLGALGGIVVLVTETVEAADAFPSTPMPPAGQPSDPAPPVEPLSVAQEPGPAAPSAPVELMGLAIVAAAGAAAPTASLGLGRLRRFAVAFLLYSRIAKERLLDHERRDALVLAIRQSPGVAVTDLARLIGAPRNTVTYHLRMLEKEGIVTSLRNGRTRLFFAAGSMRQRDNAQALAALRHDTSRAMAQAIGESPGLDQAALCERMNLTPSLAHWHADRLVGANLVTKVRQGRHVRYYPGDAFHLVRHGA